MRVLITTGICDHQKKQKQKPENNPNVPQLVKQTIHCTSIQWNATQQ